MVLVCTVGEEHDDLVVVVVVVDRCPSSLLQEQKNGRII